jgi:hypothetical protein
MRSTLAIQSVAGAGGAVTTRNRGAAPQLPPGRSRQLPAAGASAATRARTVRWPAELARPGAWAGLCYRNGVYCRWFQPRAPPRAPAAVRSWPAMQPRRWLAWLLQPAQRRAVAGAGRRAAVSAAVPGASGARSSACVPLDTS